MNHAGRSYRCAPASILIVQNGLIYLVGRSHRLERSDLTLLKSFGILEISMSEKMFASPVFVRVAVGLIEEISCLEDALEFLYDWPMKRRGSIHQTAVRACQRTFEGSFPLSGARDAFVGFAKSAKIFEDIREPMPWMIGKSGQGGDATT